MLMALANLINMYEYAQLSPHQRTKISICDDVIPIYCLELLH